MKNRATHVVPPKCFWPDVVCIEPINIQPVILELCRINKHSLLYYWIAASRRIHLHLSTSHLKSSPSNLRYQHLLNRTDATNSIPMHLNLLYPDLFVWWKYLKELIFHPMLPINRFSTRFSKWDQRVKSSIQNPQWLWLSCVAAKIKDNCPISFQHDPKLSMTCTLKTIPL